MRKQLLLYCFFIAIPLFVIAAYVINVILCAIVYILSKITDIMEAFVKGVNEKFKENFR